jgi:hypothetical protein
LVRTSGGDGSVSDLKDASASRSSASELNTHGVSACGLLSTGATMDICGDGESPLVCRFSMKQLVNMA